MDHPPEFTVICFDIANDRRRRQVVRVLQSFAERAQESVFEAWLDAAQRRRLQAALSRQLQHSEDRVAIYVLSPSDWADIVSLGRGLPAEDFHHALL